MNNENDITEIVEQLKRLQLRQSELLQRLTHLSESEDNDNTTGQANAPRELAVGDRVKITNPGRFQANSCRIIKIGTSHVPVQAKNGTKIVRAPKNLVLEE
jgi:hypothetical protein